MLITNPFSELSVTIPSIVLQAFVIAMVVLVAIGTLLDIAHKKNAKYFFENYKSVKEGTNITPNVIRSHQKPSIYVSMGGCIIADDCAEECRLQKLSDVEIRRFSR